MLRDSHRDRRRNTPQALAQDHHRNGLLQDLLMSRRKYGSDQDNSIDLVLGQHAMLDLFLLIIIRIGKEAGSLALDSTALVPATIRLLMDAELIFRIIAPIRFVFLRPQRLGLGGRLIPVSSITFLFSLFYPH